MSRVRFTTTNEIILSYFYSIFFLICAFSQVDNNDYWEENQEEEDSKSNIPSVELEHGKGLGSWQGKADGIQSRTAHLYNNSEMSDLNIVAADENWWFGDTVKDFTVIDISASNTCYYSIKSW